MAHQSARGLAFAALSEWRRGRRFADTIVQELLDRSALCKPDRAFATELFYGVLRNLRLLDFWIAPLRSTSVDDASRDLLRLGLYQLFCLQTPGHAAVFETVALGSRRQRPLLNAILRTALRRANELKSAAEAEPLALRLSHPDFLVDRWMAAYGAARTNMLCEWNNCSAPVYGRVNRLRITHDEFLAQYSEAESISEMPNFVRLTSIPTPALEQGHCYIQDPSTRVACEVLGAQPGETILDACAAPGGETGLIAELMQNEGEVIACDREPSRVEMLRANLARLGATSARTVLHDWSSGELAAEFRPNLFDRILVDAPCTNTGVIRRRVDVRWRLRPADFVRMQKEQLVILRRVLPLLKAGGVLVYSTCSLEPEENEQVVEEALQEFPVLCLEEQQSVLPFRDTFDGAFAARLFKVV